LSACDVPLPVSNAFTAWPEKFHAAASQPPAFWTGAGLSPVARRPLPSPKPPDGAFGVPCSPQFCSCQRALKVFPPQRPHVPFRDFRFDRFRRRISRPTVNTHFRRRPITGIRRGFWGEPAGSPRVFISTRRCCPELCLLQVFGDRSAHGKIDGATGQMRIQRT